MGYKLKRFLMTTLIACMSATTVYAQSIQLTYDGKTHEYNLPPIELFVNDVLIETPLMAPIQLEGRTLVPVREVCEALGANVEYKSNEKKIYIDYGDSLILLEPDNQEVWVDGSTVTLDVPAKIVNDKIMVPVRFVGEALGGSVNWIGGDIRAVYIYKQMEEPEVEEPDTEEPEVEEPDTEEPEVEEPDTEEPEVEEPDTEEPEVEDPDTEEPEIEEPDTEEPEVEDPEIEEPEESLEDLFYGIIEHYEGGSNRVDNKVVEENYATSNITRVETIEMGSRVTGFISASSPITDVEVLQDNGKVIIDIKNSKSALSSTIQPHNNEYIYNIRTSQFTPDTTRIVFDLKSGAEVEVDLSNDRKSLMVTLSQQELQEVAYGQDKSSEYVVIENFVQDQVTISDSRRSKILTVSLPNTEIDGGIVWEDLDGRFIENIYAANEGSTAVMMIELKSDTEYIHTLENVDGNLVISFKEPTFRNIDYIEEDEQYIEVELPDGLDVEEIEVIDNYWNYELVIDLGDDYEEHFGEGILPIDSQDFAGITIDTGDTTQITIDQKLIHTVEFEESGNELYINLLRPQEKYDQIVLLDIGHGGTDPGTTGNGLKEKYINDMQSDEIIKRLEEQTDIKVYTTRNSDKTLTLQYRTELANNIDADIFVSVHNNAVDNSNISGSEVLYFPDPTDSRGKQMAEIAIKNIVEAVGTVNRGAKARDNLYVLRTSNMPAILLEGGFVTNPHEAQRLQTKEFNDAYAQAVVDSIVEIFDTMSFR